MRELYHHGIEGQKWGVRNGPPYPLHNKSNRLIRVTGANNIGIYQELKNNLTKTEAGRSIWKDFLNSDINTWLNNPNVYDSSKYGRYESWFTNEGYTKFEDGVLPLIKRYVPNYKIDTKDITDNKKEDGEIVYQDKYQIVFGFDKKTIKIDSGLKAIDSVMKKVGNVKDWTKTNIELWKVIEEAMRLMKMQ